MRLSKNDLFNIELAVYFWNNTTELCAGFTKIAALKQINFVRTYISIQAKRAIEFPTFASAA